METTVFSTVSQTFLKFKLVDIGQIKLKGNQPFMLEITTNKAINRFDFFFFFSLKFLEMEDKTEKRY